MGMKFIRGMIYPNANAGGRGVSWRMKWTYEFWGFCINGTSSVTVPGGFAANNGVVMPTNFTGGTSLMASGTDGSHPAVTGDLFSGDMVFTSASATFSPTMVGKALVIWKPNSNSSEDSIYVITRVINSTQLQVNINTGGTPDPVTKHPTMTARTNVNYRVVDMETGATAGISNGAFMVLETDASSINAGQGNSQIFMNHQAETHQNTSNYGGGVSAWAGIGISGSGSWDGSSMSVQTTTGAGVSPITVTTATPHPYVTGQFVAITGVNGNTNANGIFQVTSTGSTTFQLTGGLSGWSSWPGTLGTTTGNGTYTSGGTIYNAFQNDGYSCAFGLNPNTSQAYTSGQTAVTMIGDKTFLIAHIREQDLFQFNLYYWYHFEIPTRLYPTHQDRHPVAFMWNAFGQGGVTTSSTGNGYGGGYIMRTHNADPFPARSYRTLVKAMRGDGTPDVFGQNLSDYRIGYNTIAGTIPISDACLSLAGVANQYQLARCRLRTVKFTGTHVPKHHRIGLNGEFIQLQNGVCWPWDNTIQPLQLLLFGG